MTSTRGGTSEAGWRSDPARCLVTRKCATCREQTEHAFLRDADPHADYAERQQREADARGQRTLAALEAEMEQLRACGITVVWDDAGILRRSLPLVLIQWLADGRYELRLNRMAAPAELLARVTGLWRRLAFESEYLGWTVQVGRPGGGPTAKRVTFDA